MLYYDLKSENGLDDIMADDNMRTAGAGRQRVQLLKRCIILTGMTIILLPTVLCFILLNRLQRLDKALEELAAQTESLADIVSWQQEQLEELTQGVTATRGGNADNRFLGRDLEVTQETVQGGQEGTGGNGSLDGPGIGGADKPDDGTDKPDDGTDEPGIDGADEPDDGAAEESAEVTAAHKVYLTFDDGPSKYTKDILDILDRYGVKATFFVVGKESDSSKEAMQEIVARGHTLGMHSYSHKYTEIYGSLESFAEDYSKIRDYLYEVTGVECTVYRFPGGSSNNVSRIDMEEFADYLDTQGVRFFDWNIASGDGGAKLLSVETLTKNSTKDIERFGTSVILMHDAASKPTTVEALPAIIENILALEDTVILPITEDTELVQHIQRRAETPDD